jgi:hypothetical protein
LLNTLFKNQTKYTSLADYQKKLDRNYKKAIKNGTASQIVFKIAFPSVQDGEDASCIYDPKVKYYADQIAPKSNEYLNSANFNRYL